MTLAQDYDKDFFLMHTSWRDEYIAVADVLAHRLSFKTVLDLGCGNGYIIDRLGERGWSVIGVDGSRAVLPFRPSTKIRDLRSPIDVGQHDLVICTEVAEHLPEYAADTLVRNICRSSTDLIFFSAATPGFGGHLHLNEQQPEYWLEKFEAFGDFHRDDALTEAIQNDLREIKMIWWFLKAYVLRGR